MYGSRVAFVEGPTLVDFVEAIERRAGEEAHTG